jgi:hypothetical protein
MSGVGLNGKSRSEHMSSGLHPTADLRSRPLGKLRASALRGCSRRVSIFNFLAACC